MLYLAEIQKQKTGFSLGGGKAELKLLAKQQAEHNWSAVPTEEAIPVDDPNLISKFNDGTLVLVELSASKQVQRLQEAARQLVSILQNFSRLNDKFQDKQEEIEQWKASLTFSSQEIYRREMELQLREEQVNQREVELEHLEEQRQEIETSREAAQRLSDDVQRSRVEIEGAWDQLRAEMQRVEEMQAQLEKSAVLDDDQARYIQELINYLSDSTPSLEDLQTHIQGAFDIVVTQQAQLEQHWQQLELKRSRATQQQQDVDSLNQSRHSRWQEWQKTQDDLLEAQIELKSQQSIFNAKQEQVQVLNLQIRHHDEVYQQLLGLADSSEGVSLSPKVDKHLLEQMPLDDLKSRVQELQQDLDKVVRFVNDQEEELNLQQQTIDELKAKIQGASEYDRWTLTPELEEEQESYGMLNESLVGSRRNLREREDVLLQHRIVLARRTGNPLPNQPGGEKIDLGPVLSHLESQRLYLGEELQKLENQVSQMQGMIAQMGDNINRQITEQEAKRSDIKQLEENLLTQKGAVSELWGRINLYQELLQPLQDHLTGLRQKLEGSQGLLQQVQGGSDSQTQAIAQLREVLLGLMKKPESVA